ncbi:MAG: transposase [Lachnospiraceae bacterium]|nr:transposase [Lachnospiraceae bacterium]
MSLPYLSVADYMIMLNFIENILFHFESCFSRKAAFRWFVAINIGLMLRSDKLGVTSIIRDLALNPGCYDSLLHFFRASSWSLEDIRRRWFSAVRQYAPLYNEENLHVLVGDGVKQSKEGRRMPGVKKLFQESENSAKPEYIHGHMFGGLGILAGSARNWACIPLSIRLHDGLQAAREWKGASVSAASHVVQMVEDAYHAALTFGDSLLLLYRYFLSVSALEKLKSLNDSGDVRMDIITKAKKSCTAYQKPGPRKPGRGRPPKKGTAVHLKDLFVSHNEQFCETELEFYGKKETIRYYCIDLLWGQKLYQELRFVLVEINSIQSILVSTSPALEPLSIIRLYSYRFRIECTFRELKQQIGAFCYHFWSKYMPKLSYYQKKGEPTPLERVEGEMPRKKVLEAVRAIEMHMALSCIAMGILQSISIRFMGKVSSDRIRYQRTPSRGRVSEATLMHYFRKHFFRLLGQKPELCITQIIQGLQEEPEEQWDSLAS